MRRFLPFAALIGVALVLACQDVGTGPDGLVPQFNKPLDISEEDCDDLPGFIFDEKGHCHAGEVVAEPTDIYHVWVTGDIFTTNDAGDMGVVYEAFGGGPRAVDVQLRLSQVMLDAVTCGVDDGPSDLREPLKGNLVFGNFLIDSIALNFNHNLAEHHFSSHTELPDSPWPPLPGDTVTVGPGVGSGSGEWGLQTKGQNHRDGCTGEGVGINWVAVITNVTPM